MALVHLRGMLGANTESQVGRSLSEFAESPTALLALAVIVLLLGVALAAPLVAPQNPYDLAQLSIMDNRLPPGARGFSG